MDIQTLKENRKTAVELLGAKKQLVVGLQGKLEAIQKDRVRLVAVGDDLRGKIELYDEKLEAALLDAAMTESQQIKDGLKQNTEFAEVTEKTLAKEQASVQELEERIFGIDQRVREAIAARERKVAREAAHVVNRAVEAAKLAGTFQGYDEFFRHTFTVNGDDLKAMRNEFESEARGQ